MLGVEIRERVALRANEWAAKLGASRHVHFAGTNANVNLLPWLASYPGPLQLVTIQFPDPHFKKRHRKRRIVQPELASALAAALAPGGRILIQSDVLEARAPARRRAARRSNTVRCLCSTARAQVCEDMRDVFERYAAEHVAPAPEHSDAAAAGPQCGDAGLAQETAGAQPEGEDGGDDEGGAEEDGAEDEGGPPWRSTWAATLPGGGWLAVNPVGVPTEREVATLAAGGCIYRMLLHRR